MYETTQETRIFSYSEVAEKEEKSKDEERQCNLHSNLFSNVR